MDDTKPNQDAQTTQVPERVPVWHQPGESMRDWHEDFKHENGKYVNICMFCKQPFYGHKRRVCCAICDK